MMKTIDDIRAVDWQPKLGEIGEVVEGIDDINQCIRIILTTPRGSDPHRPLFGSDIWKYIDSPVGEAIPNIIREVVDAIEMWEPRVDIKSIKAEVVEAHVTLRIEWVLKGTVESHSIEVVI